MFPWQQATWIQDVFSDANWAGCKASRKSTSGGAVLLGSHCLKTWSKTQGTIAQSSAESELLGIVKAASEALGMASLAADFGIELWTRLHVDAEESLPLGGVRVCARHSASRVQHGKGPRFSELLGLYGRVKLVALHVWRRCVLPLVFPLLFFPALRRVRSDR